MEDEIIFRKQAVQLYLSGITITEISQKLNRSRQWVHKWVNRFRAKGTDEWYQTLSTTPRQSNNRISVEEEALIITVRRALECRQYSQTGALTIMYEIERMGLKPPSIPTINRVLKRNDLIKSSSVQVRKGVEYPNHFTLVQQMDLVGPRYLTGGSRFYFQDIIDTENHHAEVYPIRDKRSITIAQTLIRFWESYGMPDYLQMDNELSFRGSNRHPRSLGLVLRLALSQGVTPIFIPPAEPWRNGMIEKFNSNVHKYFFSVQKFNGLEDVQEKASVFSDFHNQNHRYSTQAGKYPNQIESPCQKYRLGPVDLGQPLPLTEGSVIFIRFIRSDRKLTILGTSFKMKPELVYSYVIAEIIVDQHVLLVKRDGINHHVFPFEMPVD